MILTKKLCTLYPRKTPLLFFFFFLLQRHFQKVTLRLRDLPLNVCFSSRNLGAKLLAIPVEVCPDVAAVDGEPPRLRVDRWRHCQVAVAAVANAGGAAEVPAAARCRGVDDGVPVATAKDHIF